MNKAFHIFLEIIGWILICASPTLIGGLIGFIIFSNTNNPPFFFIFLGIGFFIGAIWATRIALKQSTIEWISRIAKIN